MADGITTQTSTLATVPTATKIATDDAGSPGHVQLVKLAVSTDGSATALTADNTDGLLVKVTNPTGVSVASQSQDSAGLTTATTNYATDDVIGTGWTFSSMGSSGVIRGATLVDKSGGIAQSGLSFLFFSGSVSPGADNAAISISSSDANKYLFSLYFSQFEDVGTAVFESLDGIAAAYTCDATSLYVYARSIGANPFFAATTDLRLRLFYETV